MGTRNTTFGVNSHWKPVFHTQNLTKSSQFCSHATVKLVAKGRNRQQHRTQLRKQLIPQDRFSIPVQTEEYFCTFTALATAKHGDHDYIKKNMQSTGHSLLHDRTRAPDRMIARVVLSNAREDSPFTQNSSQSESLFFIVKLYLNSGFH